MGVDLSLLPFERPGMPDDWAISHSVLFCERRSNLFADIAEIEKKGAAIVPKDFGTYLCRAGGGDSHYGNTQETPYGDPLRTLLVRDLLGFAKHEDVLDNPRNRAIWVYLAQINPETPVALFWH